MKSIISFILRHLLSEEMRGKLDYYAKPNKGRAWGGPMNGQSQRCLMVAEIILKTKPVAIIETGSYLGTTTEWLSSFQIPLWTCETSQRNAGFANARLSGISNINLIPSDSRTALRHIIGHELGAQRDLPILFYLDAHWEDDLPLAEEIDIIFRNCHRAVVVVDDFQVPDDDGYDFDNYGPEKALTLEYLSEARRLYGLSVQFPSARSSQETGMCRGCAVLFMDSSWDLSKIDFVTLRPAAPWDGGLSV